MMDVLDVHHLFYWIHFSDVMILRIVYVDMTVPVDEIDTWRVQQEHSFDFCIRWCWLNLSEQWTSGEECSEYESKEEFFSYAIVMWFMLDVRQHELAHWDYLNITEDAHRSTEFITEATDNPETIECEATPCANVFQWICKNRNTLHLPSFDASSGVCFLGCFNATVIHRGSLDVPSPWSRGQLS